MPAYDAIVIGAGIAGLTAAAYLSAAGKSTLLLEQGDVVGGCTHVFRRQGRWEFEVGVHYLGDCGPGGQIPTMLGGLGLAERIEFLPLDRDGFDTLNYPDLSVRVPVGWDNYLHNLLTAFPDDEKPLRKWVTILHTLARGVDRDETLSGPLGAKDLVINAGLAARWAMRPMTALMDHCGLRGPARNIVSTQFCAYACPPSRAPIGLHAGYLENYVGKGAYFPRGGGQVLAGHLVDVINTHGGAVRTQAEVDNIFVDAGAVSGVRLTDGERLDTKVVVSAADIKRTFLGLVGARHLRQRTVSRIRAARMSSPWANVYLGVDIDLRGITPAGNIFQFPTWDEPDDVHAALVDNAHLRARDEWMHDAGRRLPAFVHCGSAKDPDNPRLAPPGHSVLESMTPVPADLGFWGVKGHEFGSWDYDDDPAYEEMKQHMTQVLIERAVEAVPEIDGHIVYQEAGTPLTQQRYTHTSDGAAYGLEYSGREIAGLRPAPTTEVKGLFLAGCSGRWGPGVEGSMLSGMNAAGAVLGRKLGREIRGGAVLADPSRLTAGGPDWDPLIASRYMSKSLRAVPGWDRRCVPPHQHAELGTPPPHRRDR